MNLIFEKVTLFHLNWLYINEGLESISIFSLSIDSFKGKLC